MYNIRTLKFREDVNLPKIKYLLRGRAAIHLSAGKKPISFHYMTFKYLEVISYYICKAVTLQMFPNTEAYRILLQALPDILFHLGPIFMKFYM